MADPGTPLYLRIAQADLEEAQGCWIVPVSMIALSGSSCTRPAKRPSKAGTTPRGRGSRHSRPRRLDVFAG